MMPTQLDYLVLTVTLKGESIRVILNLKANRSYASLRLESKLAQYRYKKDKPYSLIIANGKFVNHDNK